MAAPAVSLIATRFYVGIVDDVTAPRLKGQFTRVHDVSLAVDDVEAFKVRVKTSRSNLLRAVDVGDMFVFGPWTEEPADDAAVLSGLMPNGSLLNVRTMLSSRITTAGDYFFLVRVPALAPGASPLATARAHAAECAASACSSALVCLSCVRAPPRACSCAPRSRDSVWGRAV